MSSIRTCIKQKIKTKKITREAGQEMLRRLDDRKAQLKAAGYSDAIADAAAAKELTQALTQKAERSKRLVRLRILATDRALADMAKFKNLAEGLEAKLAPTDGLGFNVQKVDNVDVREEGLRRLIHSEFAEGIHALKPERLGLKQPRALIENVVRVLKGEQVDDALAKTVAESFSRAAEFARVLFNQAGGAIPKAERWGLPQTHDMLKIKAVSKEEYVGYMMSDGVLDRAAMVDELGAPISDAELLDALDKMYDRVTTDGLVDLVPGQSGSKAFANRFTDHRFLHFKSAESWLSYQKRFGSDDIYGTMVNHLNTMAKNIAAMQILGPNPDRMVRWLSDVARADAAAKGQKVPTVRLHKIQNMWDSYSGRLNSPVSDGLSAFMTGTRETLTAIQLGSAVVSAVATDPFFQAMTRKMNGLPVVDMLKSYVRLLASSGDQQLAVQVLGIAENWTTRGLGVQRLYGELNGPRITRLLADGTMKASGLSQLTQAGRQAFGMSVAGTMARNFGKEFGAIDPTFRAFMQRYGMDATDWNIIRRTKAAEFETSTGHKVQYADPRQLAREGHLRQAIKIQEMIAGEGRLSTPSVGLETRGLLNQGTRPGTLFGEAMRSVALYKSFPVEIINTHLMRYASMDGWQRGRYFSTFFIGSTIMGALAYQAKQILSGKDPITMDPTTKEGMKFWAAGAAQGGGLGIFGDFFFSDANRFGKGPLSTFLGPVFGAGEDALKYSMGNIQQFIGGDDTKFLAESVQLLGRYTPVLSSLFYTKLAYQRWAIDQLSLMADPDAHERFRRMERQARKDYGQQYFWRPGKATPERAPNFNEE